MVIKNKPIEEYNKTELSNLVKYIKGNIKGQITSKNINSKIELLRKNVHELTKLDNISPQILNNVAIAESQIETIIQKEHTFSTSIIVNQIWFTIHGDVIENKINFIDKYARH